MKHVKVTGEVAEHRYRAAARFAQVQTEIRNRMRRRDCLRSELLADHAWDILLEAYAFALVNRTVTMAELTERIDLPSTTLTRWLKLLEADGMIDRAVDAAQPAHVAVAMTLKALEALDNYFSGSV